MQIDLFAGVAVDDFGTAVEWMEKLLGAPPTFKAHDTDWVWELAEHRLIYVQRQPEHAGHSILTVFVDDLDGFIDSARSRGITPDSTETYGNGVRKVIFRDPEGNEVGLGGGPEL